MEISLREWLIIGGILVIALILFDGWRRIRGNRNRIRMDIDRSAIGDGSAEDVPQSNPELPNGGARRRTHAAEHERHEPTFAADSSDLEDESDRLPEFEPAVVDVVSSGRAPDQSGDVSKHEPPEPPRSPAPNPLHEMDPLFDDVPVEPRPLRAERGPQRPESVDQSADAEALTAEPGLSATEPEPEPREQRAAAPLRAQRDESRHDDIRLDEEDDPPFAMSFEFDPEQPIPVLMDRVRAQATATQAKETQAPVTSAEEQASAPKRESSKRRRNADRHPELPFDGAEQSAETESVSEQKAAVAARQEASHTGVRADTRPSQAQAESAPKRPAPAITPNPEDMLVIFVVARRGEVLPGAVIHRIVDACGLEFGEMGIFHRYERPNAQGALQFNMANALQPGTFDLDTMDNAELPAVTFFMSMHDPADPLEAYECMLATAETLARHLDAELLDGDRSVMRPQTKEHYRERIRDFEIHKRVKRAH
ncbi:cell division protein ZipA [Marinobacterium sp. D7]|uniref:cell division protein ZipA n=1 Tax=Marinobacterium ramblicola TaxID=2849041 RepID=UPI001C2CED58|nr:cell division protein ZipA [Marinobacterium ramblicola]MBV1789374.1 cell division protein ZipA [Marinobacterium ramblicola]